MTDPAAEIKAVAAGLATGQGAGPHLTEDEIAAYHAGALAADQEARAQDHLLACPECTDLLLGLEELSAEGEPVPSAEMAAAWQRTRTRLPLPSPAAESPPRPGPLPFLAAQRAATPPWLGALAASLLVAVVGLTLWGISLRRTVDELARPQVDMPIVDLFPEPLRGGQDEVQALELAPGIRIFNLVLNPKDARTFPRYEAEIVRTGGAPVWKGALRSNAFGSFSLALSRHLMGEGEYRIRLWGAGAGGREALGEYGLRIVTPPERR